VPLAAFLDHDADDGSIDSLALTIEADGSGAIYPVVYARRAGEVTEHVIETDLLQRYDTPPVRRQLAEVVAGFGIDVAPV
jgi:hypothetical protein